MRQGSLTIVINKTSPLLNGVYAIFVVVILCCCLYLVSSSRSLLRLKPLSRKIRNAAIHTRLPVVPISSIHVFFVVVRVINCCFCIFFIQQFLVVFPNEIFFCFIIWFTSFSSLMCLLAGLPASQPTCTIHRRGDQRWICLLAMVVSNFNDFWTYVFFLFTSSPPPRHIVLIIIGWLAPSPLIVVKFYLNPFGIGG